MPDRVARALARVRGTPLEFARAEGLEVVCAEALAIGCARFYGRLEGRRITVYASPEPLERVVAHELFHWLEPCGSEEEAREFSRRWAS